jgi:hypothetical protein
MGAKTMTPSRASYRTAAVALASAAGLLALAATAGAQAPPQTVGAGPAPSARAELTAQPLALTSAQRLAIYQSVTQTAKNDPAPPGFRVAVGARVPSNVQLKPLSKTLMQLVPAASDLNIGMVEKQVILVDPTSREIVAVVTQEPSNAVH